MKRILFFENQQRSFIADALMRTMTIVLHLPQTMLITTLLRTDKAHLRKAFFIVRPIAAFDNTIAPRTGSPYQGMNSARFFNRFRKARFSFRVGGVFHRKIHRIIGKSYEKGGIQSNAR